MLKDIHCLCLVGMGEQLADINNEVYIFVTYFRKSIILMVNFNTT